MLVTRARAYRPALCCVALDEKASTVHPHRSTSELSSSALKTVRICTQSGCRLVSQSVLLTIAMELRCEQRSLLRVILVAVMLSAAAVAKPSRQQHEGRDCDPYAYCDGINFPNDLTLVARAIKCNNAPTPRDRCCLPQARHFVCYNIMVDGQYLNYDTENYARTTDFTGLCDAMARVRGKSTGKYSSAIMDNGGGHLIWRYGAWTEVEAGSQHIKNLACEIVD